ncbi:MAG: cytochrome c biogenesis CcdA family protein [Bacteriovoracaceae bacterium]
MTPIISAILAGLLTSFSPCVISALPFVISSSLSENKKGPLYLVSGLISSFVILGVIFALSTKLFGLDQEKIKMGTAILFLFIGLIFVFPKLGDKVSSWFSPLANSSNNFLNKLKLTGSLGQFVLGFLFGLVWSPCSGPTLGFALTLVAKQNEVLYGALIMLVYGIAASLPLLFVAYISKNIIQRNMRKVDAVYSVVKKLMGGFILILGLGTLTGMDKVLEAFLIQSMPQWLLDLITRF